jgi:hypothetical protein
VHDFQTKSSHSETLGNRPTYSLRRDRPENEKSVAQAQQRGVAERRPPHEI